MELLSSLFHLGIPVWSVLNSEAFKYEGFPVDSCVSGHGCCGYVTIYHFLLCRQQEPGVSSMPLSGLAVLCTSEAESWLAGGKDLEYLSPLGYTACLCYLKTLPSCWHLPYAVRTRLPLHRTFKSLCVDSTGPCLNLASSWAKSMGGKSRLLIKNGFFFSSLYLLRAIMLREITTLWDLRYDYFFSYC